MSLEDIKARRDAWIKETDEWNYLTEAINDVTKLIAAYDVVFEALKSEGTHGHFPRWPEYICKDCATCAALTRAEEILK